MLCHGGNALLFWGNLDCPEKIQGCNAFVKGVRYGKLSIQIELTHFRKEINSIARNITILSRWIKEYKIMIRTIRISITRIVIHDGVIIIFWHWWYFYGGRGSQYRYDEHYFRFVTLIAYAFVSDHGITNLTDGLTDQISGRMMIIADLYDRIPAAERHVVITSA